MQSGAHSVLVLVSRAMNAVQSRQFALAAPVPLLMLAYFLPSTWSFLLAAFAVVGSLYFVFWRKDA